MKKILFFVVAMAAIFAFDSCKKSEVSPTDVALQSMELLKNKDYKGYAELVYFADSITSDSTKLKAKKESYASTLEKNFKQKSEKNTAANDEKPEAVKAVKVTPRKRITKKPE